ncbi:MAG: hypothetical protein JWL84_4502, partial [Rhodospirillales bacterium]|nr:hypothetical protein [Rhodospirillales bacterium]
MDLLEFAARSEWPIVAGVAVFLVRQPLVKMIERLNPTNFDAWGLKIAFEQKLEKAELLAPVPEAEPTAPAPVAPDSPDTVPLERAAPDEPPEIAPPDVAPKVDVTDPRWAIQVPSMRILLAWQRLEEAIQRLARER